jgi:hypothetical protein
MNHPITPPPELVSKWASEFYGTTIAPGEAAIHIAAQAARWGADQELEACCEVLARELICDGKHVATDLRMIRRPKPLSLKEQALIELGDVYNRDKIDDVTYDTIRRALEALDD